MVGLSDGRTLPATGWYLEKRRTPMSPRNENAGEREDRVQPQNSGEMLSEFLEGVNHIAVLCVNPSHESGTDQDRWSFVIPIDGELKCVKSSLSGYVPKADLRQWAMTFRSNPEKARNLFGEFPQTEHPREMKVITVLVPLIG
jgi:hypothetical protein